MSGRPEHRVLQFSAKGGALLAMRLRAGFQGSAEAGLAQASVLLAAKVRLPVVCVADVREWDAEPDGERCDRRPSYASWGHRSAVSTRKGGGFYGYKVHAAVCALTGLPLAWTVETARDAEQHFALPLIDAARERGFDVRTVRTAIMDKGYDAVPIHDGCMDRDVCPVTALIKTSRVKRGEHKPPTCGHGTWTFAGADFKRRATKWRCPTGECKPKSRWVKADRLHPLIPRDTERSRKLYRSRGAVEREFGRLKHEWALLPLRVRGLDRVRLHADLTILAKLACRLTRERALPLAA